MGVITIRKGHDLALAGVPEKRLENLSRPLEVDLFPSDFRGLKPRMLVREGDRVEAGSPVFFDKRFPDVMFTAPASGMITSVIRGERRVLERITIDVDHRERFREFTRHNMDWIASLGPSVIRDELLSSGLWPVIRQRPFSVIADPGKPPKAVFVPAMPTAPFAPDILLQLEGREEEFAAGLRALARMTGTPVHVVIHADNRSPLFSGLGSVELHRFRGPHPAGNVGIHIHHIAPIRHREDRVWYVLPQDVARIGGLFLSGRLPVEKVIAVGGEPLRERHYLKVRHGVRLQDILKGNVPEGPARIISGDVLAGTGRAPGDPLGFYDEVVSVIPEKQERDFMGWLLPGFRKYSVTRLFPSGYRGMKSASLTTSMNGSRRVMIPFGNIESVLPMDILPTWLIKMILARDIDEMEKLGIYECDPEDFALCSFVDASKMEISEIIREGLEYIEKNG